MESVIVDQPVSRRGVALGQPNEDINKGVTVMLEAEIRFDEFELHGGESGEKERKRNSFTKQRKIKNKNIPESPLHN